VYTIDLLVRRRDIDDVVPLLGDITLEGCACQSVAVMVHGKEGADLVEDSRYQCTQGRSYGLPLGSADPDEF